MTEFQKTPSEVYADLLQAEALRRDLVADAIAQAVYGKSSIGELEPREVAQCRYAAVLAIRRIDPHWNTAARAAANVAADDALANACGRSISMLPRPVRDVCARFIVTPIITAFFGTLEGTIPQPPGRYLAIVNPEQYPPQTYRICGGGE